ncbi:hypothetical protein CEUSTIGMA_g5244.t1 [Chlamydomonas eustigma]|uniref:CCHC-type domain-containing protein n=1 Tax=Chlamydomonas eustigma TaxID=1157962 RepID=A0A250X409_9CHLO|nr:hypothetical protein CEUSTIGMA_g5244.t1 [Chlamydomonas eustigma]|eukprot:GAX77801.1 hypothetical protein CEUSTIGMA_g5244.t1 [Chlamydomonas eustigma]
MKELNPTNVFTERPSETYWEISQREESVDNRRENKVFAYVESLLDSTALGVHQVDEWSQMADNAKQMSPGRGNIAFIYLDIIRKYFEAKEMANVRIYVKELKGKKKSANQSINPELFHLVMDGLPMEYNGVLSTIRVLTGPTGYQPLLLLEQTLTVEESALNERKYYSTTDGDGGLMAGAMGQTYQPQPRPGDRHLPALLSACRHCQVQGHFMADCPYLGKTTPAPAAGQAPAPAPAAPAPAPARQMGGDRNGMAGARGLYRRAGSGITTGGISRAQGHNFDEDASAAASSDILELLADGDLESPDKYLRGACFDAVTKCNHFRKCSLATKHISANLAHYFDGEGAEAEIRHLELNDRLNLQSYVDSDPGLEEEVKACTTDLHCARPEAGSSSDPCDVLGVVGGVCHHTIPLKRMFTDMHGPEQFVYYLVLLKHLDSSCQSLRRC